MYPNITPPQVLAQGHGHRRQHQPATLPAPGTRSPVQGVGATTPAIRAQPRHDPVRTGKQPADTGSRAGTAPRPATATAEGAQGSGDAGFQRGSCGVLKRLKQHKGLRGNAAPGGLLSENTQTPLKANYSHPEPGPRSASAKS